MKKSKGFSIIELLITIALLGILISFVLAYSLKSTERTDLRNRSREIRGQIFKLRQRAVTENRTTRFTFQNSSSYKFFQRVGNVWEPLNNHNNYPDGNIGKQIKVNGVLPDFAINSRGVVLDPATLLVANIQTIDLRAPNGDRIIISLYPYGGMKFDTTYINK